MNRSQTFRDGQLLVDPSNKSRVFYHMAKNCSGNKKGPLPVSAAGLFYWRVMV